MFPSRDELVAHIERHASEDGIDLRLDTRVARIDRTDDGRAVQTSAGIPDWGGRETFEGELLHSCEYRNPEPFKGKRVLVVGPGCSGMEIAYDLAEGGVAKVWLSARTPPNILLRTGPGGLPGDVLGVALLRLPPRIGDARAISREPSAA